MFLQYKIWRAATPTGFLSTCVFAYNSVHVCVLRFVRLVLARWGHGIHSSILLKFKKVNTMTWGFFLYLSIYVDPGSLFLFSSIVLQRGNAPFYLGSCCRHILTWIMTFRKPNSDFADIIFSCLSYHFLLPLPFHMQIGFLFTSMYFWHLLELPQPNPIL